MLRCIRYKAGINLREINKDLVACENDVTSIFTPDGWKIPEEGDYIKEVNLGHWNVIGKDEIKSLAYNINNFLSKGDGIEMMETYYIDAFGIPTICKAISKVMKELMASDYQNEIKMRNLHQLASWALEVSCR